MHSHASRQSRPIRESSGNYRTAYMDLIVHVFRVSVRVDSIDSSSERPYYSYTIHSVFRSLFFNVLQYKHTHTICVSARADSRLSHGELHDVGYVGDVEQFCPREIERSQKLRVSECPVLETLAHGRNREDFRGHKTMKLSFDPGSVRSPRLSLSTSNSNFFGYRSVFHRHA